MCLSPEQVLSLAPKQALAVLCCKSFMRYWGRSNTHVDIDARTPLWEGGNLIGAYAYHTSEITKANPRNLCLVAQHNVLSS